MVAFRSSPNTPPQCMTTVCNCHLPQRPAVVYFVMTSGRAGPGNLHVLPRFAGQWLFYDFLLSPPYLAGNLSLWRGRQWAFSWLWCLFCGFICLFPRGWACVSLGIRSIAALCSGNEKEMFFPLELCPASAAANGLVWAAACPWCVDTATVIAYLSLRQKNKWNRCLIYSDGSQNAAFHVLIWLPGTRK